ncbi:N-acetylmuramoyl-L-alanine amidase [Pedobacter sp. NJ-S-72]
MDISEFEQWISKLKVAKTMLYIQQHHTWNPSYVSFTGDNHFEIQKGMKDYHINNNGWMNIAQHFTTFPDGSILTGRSLENSPACIYGFNANAVCIENMGNFDIGKDVMTDAHKNTIIRMTAALCKKFGIVVSSNKIVYHHWFNLSTGERNNGIKNNKSCPGTNFFGGNKVIQCEQNFLPLISMALKGQNTSVNAQVLKYACVTTDALNIRVAPDAISDMVKNRDKPTFGAILRVYEIINGWYRISNSAQHWVDALQTQDVVRYLVNTDVFLNIRSGPGTEYPKVGSIKKNQDVFGIEEKNGWIKLVLSNQWIKKELLL